MDEVNEQLQEVLDDFVAPDRQIDPDNNGDREYSDLKKVLPSDLWS